MGRYLRVLLKVATNECKDCEGMTRALAIICGVRHGLRLNADAWLEHLGEFVYANTPKDLS